MRVAYREDLKCSSADLVYGQNLRIPGEFFDEVRPDANRTEFAQQLQRAFVNVKAPSASNHGKRNAFVSSDLKSCSHVFVRVDSVRKPLQHPYEGPFKVLKRQEKSFDVLIGGKRQRISIDRLKPAFLCSPEINEYLPDDEKVKVTPSGLRVRFLV